MLNFAISDGADERCPQLVSPSSVAVTLGHYFEHLNLPINVFNGNSLSRQPPIKRLLLRRQRSVLGLLKWYLTIGMIIDNALITTVHLHLHIGTHGTARAGLVKGKIVYTASGLLNKENE